MSPISEEKIIEFFIPSANLKIIIVVPASLAEDVYLKNENNLESLFREATEFLNTIKTE